LSCWLPPIAEHGEEAKTVLLHCHSAQACSHRNNFILTSTRSPVVPVLTYGLIWWSNCKSLHIITRIFFLFSTTPVLQLFHFVGGRGVDLSSTPYRFDFVSNIAASDFSGLRRHLAWILRGSRCTLYRHQHHNSDRSQPAYFAFSFSGNAHKNGSGNIWLIDLVPDNHNSGFPLTLNGVNTTNSHVAGSLFSATEWNSGFLSAYLSTFNFGHPSYPLNPVPRESIRARMATRLSLRLRRIQLQDGTRRSYFQRKQRSCTTGIDIPRCADEVRHSECQCGHSEQCFHLGNGYSGSRTQYLATQGETMKDCPKCKDIDQTYSDWNK